MRGLALLGLAVLAACDSGAEAPKAGPKATATGLSPGQWVTLTEVTDISVKDGEKSAVPVEKGAKSEISTCVAAADAARTAPAVLAGDLPGKCSYQNLYMRAGRVNASLSCTREGISGQLLPTIDGTFTADSFEGNMTLTTYISGSGDAEIKGKVTARRTGECTPEVPAAPGAPAAKAETNAS